MITEEQIVQPIDRKVCTTARFCNASMSSRPPWAKLVARAAGLCSAKLVARARGPSEVEGGRGGGREARQGHAKALDAAGAASPDSVWGHPGEGWRGAAERNADARARLCSLRPPRSSSLRWEATGTPGSAITKHGGAVQQTGGAPASLSA
mmetsp:Transcript_61162/g.189462  ORF Transcript_61162/g.189462 Transcript_61162/m.189462 type:complete len:151 (+) Transcript_61162:122-574(+)